MLLPCRCRRRQIVARHFVPVRKPCPSSTVLWDCILATDRKDGAQLQSQRASTQTSLISGYTARCMHFHIFSASGNKHAAAARSIMKTRYIHTDRYRASSFACFIRLMDRSRDISAFASLWTLLSWLLSSRFAAASAATADSYLTNLPLLHHLRLSLALSLSLFSLSIPCTKVMLMGERRQ